MKLLKLVLLASLFAFSSVAQSESEVSFDGSLSELLDEYSKISNIELLIHPSVKDAGGRVSVVSSQTVTVDWTIVESMLEVTGYSAIQKDGDVHIVPDTMVEKLLLDGYVLWGDSHKEI